MGSCAEAAQNESNRGCEFWAVDLPNAWAGINGSPAPADQQFVVVVANTASETPAVVEVVNGVTGASVATNAVPPGEIFEFRLPALNQDARANTYGGQSYRVTSDVPITAYQFNPLDNTVQVFSNDASLLFPTPVLDTDYTAITADALLLSTDVDPQGANAGAFVSIVATEDGTSVDLFATWGLYPGDTMGVMLDRGEVFTAVSVGTGAAAAAGDGNLSGSRVVADKPVAVFAGNVASIDPNPGMCCADHVEQQMLPDGRRWVCWTESGTSMCTSASKRARTASAPINRAASSRSATTKPSATATPAAADSKFSPSRPLLPSAEPAGRRDSSVMRLRVAPPTRTRLCGPNQLS